MIPPSSGASMDSWRTLVERLGRGKRVGDAVYTHVDAAPASCAEALRALTTQAGCEPGAFNVLRVALGRPRVTLLDYPRFFDDAFPTLASSWTVDLDTGAVEHRAWRGDANPPVLHRKELLLDDDDPRRAAFEALTRDAEARGLFDDTSIIGHLRQWDEELRARGLRVDGHRLVARGDGDDDAQHVLRHRTAMSRRALSTPMQALWRHGYLTAEHTILDYGCGRGDDLAALRAQGLRAEGWDPHFAPDGTRAASDVVNLGFVLNVIEDVTERAAALTRAYGYARRVLAVSALIGGRTVFERYRLFRDGVLTSRGTFQKYYTHPELGAYIADVLGREPVSVGPGLYFVFRTDEDEQDFLERRQRSEPRALPPAAPAAPAPPATPRAKPTRAKPARAAKAPAAPVDTAAIEAARARRKGDLTVFLALNLFERRRSSTALSERVRGDLRALWGSAPKAHDEARAVLFSLRDAAVIAVACDRAAAEGLGHLTPGESLQLDARLVNDLPPALRVYIGCAGKLYGEAQDADVVKVHIGSGKVSLMNYDDYEGALIPMLLERVKVDLRRQQVDFFQYGDEFPPQPLYAKSRYMHPCLDGYAAQRAFDAQLLALPGCDWSGYGPPFDDVRAAIERIAAPEGMRLTASPLRTPSTPPAR